MILDEATANIDSMSEKVIQDVLSKILHNKTSIVIAHRFSTIRSADHILVMNKGRIAEEGTHLQLLALNGTYAQLCRLAE